MTEPVYTIKIHAPNGELVFVGTLPPDCVTLHRERNGVNYAMLTRVPTPAHDMYHKLKQAQVRA